MESPNRMDYQQLEKLLNRYYEGDTTPEEEILLYLALLDEPQDSPLKKDLFVIESMMHVASSMQKSTNKPKKIFSKKRLYLAIASVAAALTIGIVGNLPTTRDTNSYMNGEPLAQEDVTLHAEKAFGMLANCLKESAHQSDIVETKLKKTGQILDQSIEKLEEVQNNDYFVLTNY